jgi:hypothetical protein
MTRKRSSSAVADSPTTESDTEQEHPIADAGHEAGQTAGHLAERATNVGFKQADHAREQTADGLHQLADSVRRVSGEMESEQPAIANLTSTAAEQTERIAEFLHETDARQLVHTVEDVARRQPLLFVGGAFLLGIAASRFIKAAGGTRGSSTGNQYGRDRRMGGMSGGYRTYDSGGSYGTGGAYEATGPGGIGRTDTDRLSSDPADEGLRP